MNAQTQAEAEQLEASANELAARFMADPKAGYRAGYKPTPTVSRSNLLGTGRDQQVDAQVLPADWLRAIAEKGLKGWHWRIDESVLPPELVILGRR
jgi:hypothetical protein